MALSYPKLLQDFEQCLRVERNLAARTRKAYLYDLTRLQEHLILMHGRMPLANEISADALREYLNYCQVELGYKSTTLARVISSIRALFDFAVDPLVIDDEQIGPGSVGLCANKQIGAPVSLS